MNLHDETGQLTLWIYASTFWICPNPWVFVRLRAARLEEQRHRVHRHKDPTTNLGSNQSGPLLSSTISNCICQLLEQTEVVDDFLPLEPHGSSSPAALHGAQNLDVADTCIWSRCHDVGSFDHIAWSCPCRPCNMDILPRPGEFLVARFGWVISRVGADMDRVHAWLFFVQRTIWDLQHGSESATLIPVWFADDVVWDGLGFPPFVLGLMAGGSFGILFGAFWLCGLGGGTVQSVSVHVRYSFGGSSLVKFHIFKPSVLGLMSCIAQPPVASASASPTDRISKALLQPQLVVFENIGTMESCRQTCRHCTTYQSYTYGTACQCRQFSNLGMFQPHIDPHHLWSFLTGVTWGYPSSRASLVRHTTEQRVHAEAAWPDAHVACSVCQC